MTALSEIYPQDFFLLKDVIGTWNLGKDLELVCVKRLLYSRTEASVQVGCLYWLQTVQNADEIPSAW